MFCSYWGPGGCLALQVCLRIWGLHSTLQPKLQRPAALDTALSHPLLRLPRPEVARDGDVVPDVVGLKIIARLASVQDDLEVAKEQGAHDAAL